MAGWHHQLNGGESQQAPGDGEGQGSLVCCSPWGHKESDTTEQLNNDNDRKHVEKERRKSQCKVILSTSLLWATVSIPLGLLRSLCKVPPRIVHLKTGI